MRRRVLKSRKWILAVALICCVLYTFPCLREALSASYPGLVPSRGDCGSISRTYQEEAVDPSSLVVNVAFFGKYAYKNMKIARGIYRCLGSILRLSTVPLHFHVLLDLPSKARVSRTMEKLTASTGQTFDVTFHDVMQIARDYKADISTMRRYFFTKDVGRYHDDIFFISQLLHRILNLDKVILIDVDLKFLTDIGALYREFQAFGTKNVIGIANDLQPQYRIDFSEYRKKNPGTSVGSARPGQQGFNAGVILFDLQRMRSSALYNSLLNGRAMREMCQKYSFKGYMGHQDFYTITGMEYPGLYHTLDCTWNRQLDIGWLNSVSPAVFEEYHSCSGEVKVYHANGGSLMPNDFRRSHQSTQQQHT